MFRKHSAVFLAIIAIVSLPAGGAAAPTDEAAFHRQQAAWETVPFSFVYGGRPSAELIGKWKRTVDEKAVDAAKLQRTITFDDPETKLQVRAVLTVYIDTPAVDWTLYLTNQGDKDTPIIEQFRAVDVTIKQGGEASLHRLVGSPCWPTDWTPLDDVLPAGKRIEFGSGGGRSASTANGGPFFNLQWPGGGVITAVGWSGEWSGVVERQPGDLLRIQAGMKYMRLKLHPGETIRSPRIVQLYWFGDDPWRGYNRFRRLMFAHVMPRIEGQLVVPPIAAVAPLLPHQAESEQSKYLTAFKESDSLAEIKSIAGLGYELYWCDAWYTPGGFPFGVGNYGLPLPKVMHDPVRFPRGLRPTSDAAHQAGMKFLVWFEPERVSKDTYIDKHHPEFVIDITGNAKRLNLIDPGLQPPREDQRLFNLGLPQARQYMTEVLSAAIDQWRMDCLRIDFNLEPLFFWRYLDEKEPDRVGMTEIRYIEGLYRMWDDLLKAHPHLFIDNVASGGRRIDLETCSRSIPLWRTDATIGPYTTFNYNQTSLQNQAITAGLSRYVPFSTSGQVGAQPYHFRSGFNAGIAIPDMPPENERELLKQGIAEGKRIRKYYFGDFYALPPVYISAKDWCVMQYHRAREQDGMVMAFRRHESPAADFAAQLHDIDPAADYEVTFAHSYEPSVPRRIKGAALAALKLRVEQCPGSVLVEYRRLKP